jgi:hypothetical protein
MTRSFRTGSRKQSPHEVEAVEALRQATEMRWQYMTGVDRVCVLKEEP